MELSWELFIYSDVWKELWSSRKFLVDFFASPESLSYLNGSSFYVRVDTAVEFIHEFIHAVDSRGRFLFKP